MLYLDAFNGAFNIPLAALTSFSYSKNGRIVATQRNTFTCKGFECREIATGFNITPNMLDLFNAVNKDQFKTFRDLVNKVTTLNPDRNSKPCRVILGGKIICPELLFSLTSTTQTFQSDRNGNMQECDVSWSLSGSTCSKDASSNPITSYDPNSKIPKIELRCKGKSVVCQDDISISTLQLTPTTLNITLLLSTSFKEKSSNAWVNDVSKGKSYFTVEGYGTFWVKNSSTDEDSVSYECSVFCPEAESIITKTYMGATLDQILRDLDPLIRVDARSNSIASIDIDNYITNKTPYNILKDLSENLGILVAFDKDNVAHLVEVPDKIKPSGILNYYIDDDVVSTPTNRLIYRDGEHEYITNSDSNSETSTYIVNSPINTKTDRSKQLLKYVMLYENEISLTVPYDSRIKQFSQCTLNYNNGSIDVIILDYSIDVLQNTMMLKLGYVNR